MYGQEEPTYVLPSATAIVGVAGLVTVICTYAMTQGSYGLVFAIVGALCACVVAHGVSMMLDTRGFMLDKAADILRGLPSHKSAHAREGHLGDAYFVVTVAVADRLCILLFTVPVEQGMARGIVEALASWSVEPDVEAAILSDMIFQIKSVAERLELAGRLEATDHDLQQQRLDEAELAKMRQEARELDITHQHVVARHVLRD